MKKTLAAVALLTALGLTLAACGDDTSKETAADFNDADVSFAAQMIPHHQQAIEMSQLADERAASDEVKELATQIEAAQGPEIETLTGWLEAWGEETPSDDMDHSDMGHGTDSGMSGMMDAEQMSTLESASGAAFDRMFLQLMVDHHEGAVEMAKIEVTDGENSDAIDMAQKVISDQQAEIDQMLALLGS